MTANRRRELLIVNPNASAKVTGWLAAEARRLLGRSWAVVAVNADSGLAAIRTPADLQLAAPSILSAIAARPHASGAVIAAFGDPGLKEARGRKMMAISGLGESGILAAAEGGRRFSIVTIGAAMRAPILEKVAQLRVIDQLAAVRFLPFDIAELIEDRDRMRNAIAIEARASVAVEGAEAVLLGGAPFAGMAISLGRELSLTILDGVQASIDRLGSVVSPADH
jgi:allantoin racemase